MRSLRLTILCGAWVLCTSVTSHAQTVEVTPLVGYRFGGGLFERMTGRPVDLDGAPTVGAVVNLKLRDHGLFAEALFSHQEARVSFSDRFFAPPATWRITIDHWQGGGLQEFPTSESVRPFLTGLLGLTRYGAAGDNEVRFTVGAGGGVKWMPGRTLGVRLDSRVFATFADLDARGFACVTGACLFVLDADVVWQAEFSAGLVIAFR